MMKVFALVTIGIFSIGCGDDTAKPMNDGGGDMAGVAGSDGGPRADLGMSLPDMSIIPTLGCNGYVKCRRMCAAGDGQCLNSCVAMLLPQAATIRTAYTGCVTATCRPAGNNPNPDAGADRCRSVYTDTSADCQSCLTNAQQAAGSCTKPSDPACGKCAMEWAACQASTP